MTLPTPIQRLLDDQKALYEVSDLNDIDLKQNTVKGRSACLVKSLILQDSRGRVQVLLPAHRAVDLDAISSSFGRQFEGVAVADIFALIQPLEMSQIPALPVWQDIPLAYDTSLHEYPSLWLESGAQKELVQVEQETFAQLVAKGKQGDFAKDIPVLEADPDHDEKLITKAIDRFTELRIQQRLEDTLDLPPLPETAQKIIHLRANPDADISDLTEIIELDPSLAAQVVSWASSPYYSAPGKIRSVHDAIVRVLGFDMVLNLALGLALGRTFSYEAMTKAQLSNYWRSSVYTAAAVEGLVTSISREHRPSFGLSYLCGLLSNFGYLIMAEVFPPYFQLVNKQIQANHHLSAASLEHDLLGVTSSQMAAWLLGNWGLPEPVVTAIRQQHNIFYKGENSLYPQLVYLAQTMLGNHGILTPLGGPLPEHLFKSLHLDRETAEIAIENVLDSEEDLDNMAETIGG